MDILIINGSPKGEYSITLQTAKYIEALFPQHNFGILNAGQQIKSLEKNFEPATKAIEKADLLIFSYPVYTFIAPYQLHRFIELMKENRVKLFGKYATQLTTSKHFYDITAHRYIEDNCHDMGLKYIRGLSADMDDLLTKKGQQQAKSFFEYVLFCIDNAVFEKTKTKNSPQKHRPVDVPPCTLEMRPGDVVILTDCQDSDTQLKNMIARFIAKMQRNTRVINLRDLNIKGGCLGCFNCAVSGKCIYKDSFDDYLRNDIQKTDAIVTAFSIKDHSMGSLFKLYDDRQFCNGHRTVTMGMPIGYLISGNYSQESNLQTIIEGRAQVGNNFIAGIATDEYDPDKEIDDLATSLEYALTVKYIPPQNFYGVGGMKIFRDLIWLMQGMMKADHNFYKKHGQYDFPQKKRGTILKMYLVGALISSPKIKKQMGNKMNEGMIMPYKKVLNEVINKEK